MIAYLRDEPDAGVVEESLDKEDCVAHVINLCEVYYDFIRSEDEPTASEAMEDLKSSGVVRVAEKYGDPIPEPKARQAS